jgi:hypothetical protein
VHATCRSPGTPQPLGGEWLRAEPAILISDLMATEAIESLVEE